MARLAWLLTVGPALVLAGAGRDEIGGGQIATEGEFPSAVKITFGRSNQRATGCTGTIISEQEVLTAAHCCLIEER
jgi:secreted trypsin-like serine protease